MPENGPPTRAQNPWGTPPPLPTAPSRTARLLRRDVAPPTRATYLALAATTVVVLGTVTAPSGAHWVVVAALVAMTLRSVSRAAPPAGERAHAAMRVLAAALICAGAVSDNPAMVTLCLFAAVGLAVSGSLAARRWAEQLLAPLIMVRTAVLGVVWLAAPLRRTPVRALLPWLRGALVGGLLTAAAVALLASADSAFAGLVEPLVPDALQLPIYRLIATATVMSVVIALAMARREPPAFRVATVRRRRPMVEWVLPLLLLNVVLVAFAVVQLAVLLGIYPEAMVWGGQTPAARARHGFGELVVVTLLVAAAVGRAGRRADVTDSGHRLALGWLGGTAVVGALVLVASALSRMWFYENAFGATVLRLLVGVFEVWLGVMLVAAAAVWWRGGAPRIPRLVLISAGVVLLGLTVTSPDALVARWNLDRLDRTGRFDSDYARRLSDDAVPVLAGLPQPQLCEVLANRAASPDDSPWYAVNLARVRAERALDGLSCGVPLRTS